MFSFAKHYSIARESWFISNRANLPAAGTREGSQIRACCSRADGSAAGAAAGVGPYSEIDSRGLFGSSGGHSTEAKALVCHRSSWVAA